MNQCLIQIDDNYGAVKDDKGNVRVVSKESTEASFEDILKKENNLSTLSTQLEDDKEKLAVNKHNIIMGEVCNLSIYGGMVALYYGSKDKLTPVGVVLLIGSFYGTFKWCARFVTGGFRLEKSKERKELKADIETLEKQIPELEKELKESKENAKYEDNVTAIGESEPYKQIVNAMDALSNDDQDTLKTSNLRILKL